MEQNETPNWGEYSAFDRYEKLSDLIKHKGQSVTVTFEDEGRLVSEDVLKEAMKAKGLKQKPSASYVFICIANQKKYEFWVKKQNYTIMRQLAAIAKGKKLTGQQAIIKRVSEGDPTTSAYEVTSLD